MDADERDQNDQRKDRDERDQRDARDELDERTRNDPLIDPAWPEQAQQIVADRHARSAARPGDVAPPT